MSKQVVRGGRSASRRTAVDAASIETAVVQVACHVLGRTEAATRADRARYAAFHMDDDFVETHLPGIETRRAAPSIV